MMKAITLAGLILAMASPAWAGFVENRTQWNDLGAGRKADYAMGLFDGLAQVSHDDPVDIAAVEARVDCLVALEIDSSDLALLIDEGYAADASTWADAPLALLIRQTNRVCRDRINAAVVEAGGQPFID